MLSQGECQTQCWQYIDIQWLWQSFLLCNIKLIFPIIWSYLNKSAIPFHWNGAFKTNNYLHAYVHVCPISRS